MIVLDASAVVAILLGEEEATDFSKIVASEPCLLGAPTLVEALIVLEKHLGDEANRFVWRFVSAYGVTILPFDAAMSEAATQAFRHYGKGHGHPARLNFGDCLAYAVAKRHALPLLFKGNDFVHTDIEPACLSG
jgi:ribonuclease VapC